MCGKYLQLLPVLLIAAGAVCPAFGQVAPGAVSGKLMGQSVEAVLGTDRPIEWNAIPLDALQEEKLKLRQRKSLPDTLYAGRLETEKGTRWI
ncbi:MAG: hypothetical protein R3224_05440, partial [Balneolaceae bacterium]|nr:hypothetical protein [Balneolaceae bacterium]